MLGRLLPPLTPVHPREVHDNMNMATAARKTPQLTLPSPPRSSTSMLDHILRVFDAIYRFLASLKLAVITLATLAAVLAYATFFERRYGNTAVQEWIYRGPGFAILLAFLGANILCAALIRCPWKKRQTGFLITHTGLLVLLVGSWWSFKSADEGQFGMLEGQTMSELYRREAAAFRIRRLDPETGGADSNFSEYELPFHPSTFPWGQGKPKPLGVFGSISHLLSHGSLTGETEEVISQPKDPFKVTVKGFLPASEWAVIHEPDPSGTPLAKIRVLAKPPGMPTERDSLPADEQWFTLDKVLNRLVKQAGMRAPLRVAFQYADKPEFVEDFLTPPKIAGKEGVATFHYRGKDGKPHKYEWALDGQKGKSLALPESDLTVTFAEVRNYPAARSVFSQVLLENTIPVASFKVRKGGGVEVVHAGWASLPMLPTVASAEEKLVDIHYFRPPVLDPKSNGLFGLIEVLGIPDGTLYYRVFGRGENGLGQLRASNPLKKREKIIAFGGNPNMPMTISFQVEDYLTSGVEKEVCEPIELPPGKKDSGVGASLIALTMDDTTQEFWVRGSLTLDKAWQQVAFPSGVYEVAFDADRRPLDFQLTLEDFQRGFDPGTEQPSRFASTVLLTDKERGIKDQRITIAMNQPLTHRGFTFYQQEYRPEFDPKTLQETGRFISILQVATDPGRPIKYAGCLLVVLGAFVQFYMRAGVFTDGGKKERERAAARARKPAGVNGKQFANGLPETSVTDVTESEDTL